MKAETPPKRAPAAGPKPNGFNGPKDAEAHIGLAASYLSANKIAAGQAELERALAIRPSHMEANYNLGLLMLRAGRPIDAQHRFEKALKADTNKVDILNGLGLALTEQGLHGQAIRRFNRAHQLAPGRSDIRINLAAALVDNGQPDHAVPHFKDLCAEQPKDQERRLAYAMALSRAGDWHAAAGQYEKILADTPQCFEALMNLGGLLIRIAPSEAVRHLTRAAKLEPQNISTLYNLANAHLNADDPASAKTTCNQIMRLDPMFEDAPLLHIEALNAEGDFAGASTFVRKRAGKKPMTPEQLIMLSHLQGQRLAEAELSALREAVDLPDVTARQRIRLLFFLGAQLDIRGEYDAAFAAYCRANADRNIEYDDVWKNERDDLKRLETIYTATSLASPHTAASKTTRPLFIVGLPRSGTTLVEQILAAHPSVTGGGELETLTIEMGRLAEFGDDRRWIKPNKITVEMASDTINDYLQTLNAVSIDSLFVTDKTPTNFLNIGLIATLFPKAKIIHCRRSPKATALSIYAHDFVGWYPFAYDLERLGLYYRQYLEMMEHWHEALPGRIYDVDYETLVTSQEDESKKLLDNCGLEWNPVILDFHKSKRCITTSSAWQVRQPLYTTSLAHWKNYAAHLEPFERAFAGETSALEMNGRGERI